MKKSLLLLLLPFLCGCSEKEEPIGGPVIGPTYLIARYVEGDMKLDYIPRTAATDGKSNTLYIDWADTEEYYNPDMEKYNLGRQEFWTPENKAKYLEIAKRNGDEIGAYEGGTPPGLYFGDQIALADNFTSMHITSDADWDEEHPAGKPLDDLFRVSVRSWKQRDEYGAPLLCRERMDRTGTFADDPFQSEESVGRPEEFAADRNRTACRACVGATSPIDAHDDHHRRTYKIDFDRLSAENGTIADLIL